MIIRWYVNMQELDYTLRDILGSNNPVADGFSRCVRNHMTSNQHVVTTLIHIPDAIILLIQSVHISRSGHHSVDRAMHMLTIKNRGNAKSGQVLDKIPYLRTMH